MIKWYVIIFLFVFSFLFTGGTVYAKRYAEKYEAELQEMYKLCYMDGWKESSNKTQVILSKYSYKGKNIGYHCDNIDKIEQSLLELQTIEKKAHSISEVNINEYAKVAEIYNNNCSSDDIKAMRDPISLEVWFCTGILDATKSNFNENCSIFKKND